MGKTELKIFIKKHLYNELRYLLCATASWELASAKPESFPQYFVVYTLDSASLHARSLFEFFTYKAKSNNRKGLVTWEDFGLKERINSEFYEEWIEPLHRHLMHLKDRINATNIKNGAHLKNRVSDFSIEIVRIWKIFSTKIDSDLKIDMDFILEKSIKDAEKIYPRIREILKN